MVDATHFIRPVCSRDVFSQVSADDLLETFSLVSDLSKDLGKLDFVIIFTSERVSIAMFLILHSL